MCNNNYNAGICFSLLYERSDPATFRLSSSKKYWSYGLRKRLLVTSKIFRFFFPDVPVSNSPLILAQMLSPQIPCQLVSGSLILIQSKHESLCENTVNAQRHDGLSLFQIKGESQPRRIGINTLHPNISRHILHTVHYTFRKVLTRRKRFLDFCYNQELL